MGSQISKPKVNSGKEHKHHHVKKEWEKICLVQESVPLWLTNEHGVIMIQIKSGLHLWLTRM